MLLASFVTNRLILLYLYEAAFYYYSCYFLSSLAIYRCSFAIILVCISAIFTLMVSIRIRVFSIMVSK